IEYVSANYLHERTLRMLLDEALVAGAEVIVDDCRHRLGCQAVHYMAADESGATCNKRLLQFHSCGSFLSCFSTIRNSLLSQLAPLSAVSKIFCAPLAEKYFLPTASARDPSAQRSSAFSLSRVKAERSPSRLGSQRTSATPGSERAHRTAEVVSGPRIR